MPLIITQLNPPRLIQTLSTYIGEHYTLISFEVDDSQLLPHENIDDFEALVETVNELNFTLHGGKPLDQNGNPIQVSTEYQQMVDNLPFLKNISDSQEDTQ